MRKINNSSLTQSSREFEKSSLDGLMSYPRSDFPTQPTNLTQDTRIANDSNNSSLRGDSHESTKQSTNSPSLAEGVRGWVKSTSALKKDNAQFKNAIAITGGIATGKSTACNILKLHGYSIIDMDKISHEVLEANAREVVGAFGSRILVDSVLDSATQMKIAESNLDSAKNAESTPKINRKKLGEIVFNNKAKLAKLESILHPKIRTEVEQKAQVLEAQNITYFIDIPIFFELQEKGKGYEIPRVLLIYAPREVQLTRIIKRDNLSAESANARLANQIDIERKKQMADFVIENTGNIRDLQSKIEAFLREII